jgi:hypothetical protein
LEAAGTATALDSELGRERISQLIWNNDDRPDLRMETVWGLGKAGLKCYEDLVR